jgi:hypothetical protein
MGATGFTGATGLQGSTGIGSMGATGFTGATGPAGGGGSITPGTIDNAVLRADGTGGTLLQNSDILIDDAVVAAIASGTTRNVAIVNNHQGQTDSVLVLTPKGNGAFVIGPKPNGSTSGGNVRGHAAIDLQLWRSVETEVASGTSSVCLGGYNTSSSERSISIGHFNNCSGGSGVAIGSLNTVSAFGSSSIGRYARSDRASMLSNAHVNFSGVASRISGECQFVRFILTGKTTNNTPTELFLDGFAGSTRLTIPSGKIMNFSARITGIKSDGTDQVATRFLYSAQTTPTEATVCGWIKNVSATTAGSITFPSSFRAADGVGWSVTADDALDCLKITVTGKTGEIWRWIAVVEGTELAYGE